MKIELKLDEADKSMVLMYTNGNLLGAAHIDCFEELNIEETELTEEISLFELLCEFDVASVTTKLSIIDEQKHIDMLYEE